MRVTDSIIRDQIKNFLTSSQERLSIVQRQLSTNKEVNVSSDDPIRFDQAGRFRSLLAKNEQYLGNIEDGISWIKIGTESMDIVYGALEEIKTLGLKTRGDADPDARAKSLSHVEALIEETVLMGNSRFLGKYVFGGTITKDTEPFSYDGTAVTYNGNNGALTRKVAENTYLQINTVGSDFQGVFDSAIALRDAMAANDGNAMDTAIGQIETASAAFLTTIAKAGSLQRKMELTRDNLEMANVNIGSYISQAEDVDLAEAILQYNAQELGYRAALESSSRIMSISILDHLR